jgi:O-antigen/teichoic acid export membrane protein
MRHNLDRLLSLAHRPMIREFVGFGSSTVLEQGSRLATSLVAAGLVGPVEWGIWYVMNLILRYGALAHLGALNGLNRQYPLEVGRGNPAEAERLRRASLGALAISTLPVLIITAFVLLYSRAATLLLPIALTLLLLVCQQLYSFVTITFKSRISFSSVSRAQGANAVLTPLITLPLTYALGLNGYILGQAASYAVIAILAYLVDRSIFQPAFSRKRSAQLIRIGFPIMLVGVLYALFTTVDRWVILQLMTTEALGYYSIAIMALGAAALLPQVVAQQYYPRMSNLWGANQDILELTRLARTQGRLGLIPTTTVVILAELLGPPLIRSLLPEYAPGIPAFRVIMLAPIINCFGQGFANLLNVTDRQYQYIGVILASIAINAICSYALGSILGLVGVAWGTVIGFSTFSTGLVLLGHKQLRK